MGNVVVEFKNEDKGVLKNNKHKVPVAAVTRQQNASDKDPSHWFYWNWNDKPEDFDTCIQSAKQPSNYRFGKD